jgi:hypothetical protein
MIDALARDACALRDEAVRSREDGGWGRFATVWSVWRHRKTA